MLQSSYTPRVVIRLCYEDRLSADFPISLSERTRFCRIGRKHFAHPILVGACLTAQRSLQHRNRQCNRLKVRRLGTCSIPAKDTLPYKIVPVDGKGLGVVATRAIDRGELVMSDDPVITFRGNDRDWIATAVKQFEELAPEKQVAVMALADVGIPKTIEGIIRTNNYPRGVNSDDGVLCLEFSRFNHSCQPNCEQSWNEDTRKLEAHACTPIEAGEELCTYFVDVRDPKASRQQILQTVYRFRCACPVCLSTDSLAESRRVQMQELGAKIDTASTRNPKRAVKMLAELMGLYDLADIRPNLVRKQACDMAAKLLLKLDDKSEAGTALELALQFSTLCHGPDHPHTLQSATNLNDLQNSP